MTHQYSDPNDAYVRTLYRLSPWMLAACQTEQEREEAQNTYFLVESASNGRCLFHSIRICLHSVFIDQPPYTCDELLNAVLETFLDDDDDHAQSVLLGWYNILKDVTESRDQRMRQLKERHGVLMQCVENRDVSGMVQHGHVRDILYCKQHKSDACIQSILSQLTSETHSHPSACYSLLQEWFHQVARDIENEYLDLSQEYRHASILLSSKPGADGLFDRAIREKLVHALRDPNVFWGEEYAIRVLERKLNVKFLILRMAHVTVYPSFPPTTTGHSVDTQTPHDNSSTKETTLSSTVKQQYSYVAARGQVTCSIDDDDEKNSVKEQQQPSWYFVLFLLGNHYQPMVKRIKHTDGTYRYIGAFKKHMVPLFVTRAFDPPLFS